MKTANEQDIKAEGYEMLMPDDKLHVLDREPVKLDREPVMKLAEEFVNNPHRKPLVIFYNDWSMVDHIQNAADRILRPGKIFDYSFESKNNENCSEDEIIQDIKSYPHLIVRVRITINKDAVLTHEADRYMRFLVNLANATGKKVYGMCRCDKMNDIEVDQSNNNNVVYSDLTSHIFGTWHEEIDFAIIDKANLYRRTRQLFLACQHNFNVFKFLKGKCCDGDATTVLDWLNDPKKLIANYRVWFESKSEFPVFLNIYLDDMVNVTSHNKEKWTISLLADDSFMHGVYPKLAERVKSNKCKPEFSMWIEIKDNKIVDYQDSDVDFIRNRINHK